MAPKNAKNAKSTKIDNKNYPLSMGNYNFFTWIMGKKNYPVTQVITHPGEALIIIKSILQIVSLSLSLSLSLSPLFLSLSLSLLSLSLSFSLSSSLSLSLSHAAAIAENVSIPICS